PQVPGVVREKIQTWIASAQPAREQVNGQRKAVHFGEQRHQEGREGAKRAPVPCIARVREAEGEDDEDCRVEHYERPEAVGRSVVVHRPSPWEWSSCLSWPACPWPWPRCRSRCNTGHRRKKRYGKAPSTCARCSVIRKKAAMARNPSSTTPLGIRSQLRVGGMCLCVILPS